MVKNWKQFNEGLWDDFKKEWNMSKLPELNDLPFKVGDLTPYGKIIQIDKPWVDNGELADILVKVDGDKRWLRASEIEIIEPEIEDTPSDDTEPIVNDLKDEVEFPTVMSIDIRACKIEKADRVPKKDRLIILEINTGFGNRQVLTNLGQEYDVSDFEGKTMWFVLNLKPAKIAGIVSEGMIVAANSNGKSKLITTDLPIGSKMLG